MQYKILIAEDEEVTLNNLIYVLNQEGYKAVGTNDGESALKNLIDDSYDLLITDIRMPGLSGLALIDEITRREIDIDIIVITAYGSIESAVETIKKGAKDYIAKPFILDELLLKIKNLREYRVLRNENTALRTSLMESRNTTLITASKIMKDVLTIIDTVKDSDCNLLVTGESGVGKSLIVKLIHYSGTRHENPFIGLNCATFSEELLNSELFGHEAGSFTGASRMKKGLVEIADTGTLFLDEIAELTVGLSAKLLKFIEEGEFYRVGGIKPIKVDVRIVAATNKDIPLLISEGKFRSDLFYRLNVMEIHIPPLRERRDDIIPLSQYFLQKHIIKYPKKIRDFSKAALDALLRYEFPGNVRELENIVERAIIVERSDLITFESLQQRIPLIRPVIDVPATESIHEDKVLTIDKLTKEYASKVVKIVDGNRTKAAELLGISRTSLWKILKD